MPYTQAIIDQMKEDHRIAMEKAAHDIRTLIENNGMAARKCDIMLDRKAKEAYHRGAWNALNSIERQLRGL